MTSADWKNERIQAPWAEGNVAGDGREAVDRRSLELETEDLISSFPYAIDWTQENVPAMHLLFRKGSAGLRSEHHQRISDWTLR